MIQAVTMSYCLCLAEQFCKVRGEKFESRRADGFPFPLSLRLFLFLSVDGSVPLLPWLKTINFPEATCAVIKYK